MRRSSSSYNSSTEAVKKEMYSRLFDLRARSQHGRVLPALPRGFGRERGHAAISYVAIQLNMIPVQFSSEMMPVPQVIVARVGSRGDTSDIRRVQSDIERKCIRQNASQLHIAMQDTARKQMYSHPDRTNRISLSSEIQAECLLRGLSESIQSKIK